MSKSYNFVSNDLPLSNIENIFESNNFKSKNIICSDLKFKFSKCLEKSSEHNKLNQLNQLIKKYCSDDFGFRCSDR